MTTATGPVKAANTCWSRSVQLTRAASVVRAFRRAPCHECVAVHVERTRFVLAFGAAERVGRFAAYDVGEVAVLEHFLPARTGQPVGYSTGPQLDVPQRSGWHRGTVGDGGELDPPAGAQHPEDLGEHRVLVGAQVDDPLEITTSAQQSSTGNTSAKPWRNSTCARPSASAVWRDFG